MSDRSAGVPRRPTGDAHRFLVPEAQLPRGFAERLDGAAEVVAPRPAATIALLREEERGVEVLLLRRHRRSGFAAGAWVFPGGVVDEEDRDPELARLSRGPSPEAWARRMDLQDSLEAYGYVVAALREAFEETGILLAGPALPAAVREREREALLAGERSLVEMARAHDLCYRTDEMLYAAHWITPEPEPRRYDTRFFLGRVPEGAPCTPHEAELVEARWTTPAEAVEGFRSGELPMLPPTVHTLASLAEHDSLDALWSALAEAPVPAILPRMRRHPEGVAIEIPETD